MAATLFILFLYFIPTIAVLSNDNKKSKAPAIIVNVFLGWTFIGWVVALAMAVSKD